jgi:hypothetical protein
MDSSFGADEALLRRNVEGRATQSLTKHVKRQREKRSQSNRISSLVSGCDRGFNMALETGNNSRLRARIM